MSVTAPNSQMFRHKAGKVAPLIHKWFARRRPDAIRRVLDGLDGSSDARRLRVMDPFAGSGMILLECLMDGHDVFGVDINPVAWLIARQTLSPPTKVRMEESFGMINESVGDRIRYLFTTETPEGVPSEFVTGFYVRVVRTPQEGKVELHHNYLLARDRGRNWAVYYCPTCCEIFSGDCSEFVRCTKCYSAFYWQQGTVSRGQVRVMGRQVRLSEFYKQEVGPPEYKLIAVESYSKKSGRRYHRPSAIDFENVETAKLQCRTNEIACRINDTRIPMDRRDPRPISHGFSYYGQLFSPRQLLSLSLISEAISNLDDPDSRYAMALALSDAAGNNNRMCRYAADWLKLTPAFGLHGFDVVTRPVEGNVWGASRGRGSFRNCVSKASRAYSTIGSSILAASLDGSSPPQRDVRCLPSQALSEINWDDMDAIVTDPPYFDNLDYGELSDFYFQWLRITLNNEPPFDKKYSLSETDLSRIAVSNLKAEKFGEELAKVFRQALRKLKPKGVVAFSYHHAKAQAWKCLATALRRSGIVPYRLMFVRSELDNGFHSSVGNIKIDSIFYCRKRDEVGLGQQDILLEDALRSLSTLDQLKSIDITSARYAMAAALATLNPAGDFEGYLASIGQFSSGS